jgi:hypothetical protein
MDNQPLCPTNYNCTFNPKIPHGWVPWYQDNSGAIMAFIGIIAITAIIITLAYYWYQYREMRNRNGWLSKRERRQERELAEKREIRSLAARQQVAEQITMQIDACKGNPEMLTIVKQMQKDAGLLK